MLKQIQERLFDIGNMLEKTVDELDELSNRDIKEEMESAIQEIDSLYSQLEEAIAATTPQ